MGICTQRENEPPHAAAGPWFCCWRSWPCWPRCFSCVAAPPRSRPPRRRRIPLPRSPFPATRASPCRPGPKSSPSACLTPQKTTATFRFPCIWRMIPSFGSQTDRPSYGGQDHRPYNGSQPYGSVQGRRESSTRTTVRRPNPNGSQQRPSASRRYNGSGQYGPATGVQRTSPSSPRSFGGSRSNPSQPRSTFTAPTRPSRPTPSSPRSGSPRGGGNSGGFHGSFGGHR